MRGFVGPIVLHKARMILCSIPKAACTKLRQFAHKLGGSPEPKNIHDAVRESSTQLQHLSRVEAERLLNDPTYTKVAFVRHPFTRLWSAFVDKIIVSKQFKRPPLEGANMSFEQFVDLVSKTKAEGLDEHFMDYSALCGFRFIHYDHVGRFEYFLLGSHAPRDSQHQFSKYLSHASPSGTVSL